MEEQISTINDKVLDVYINARTNINMAIFACRKRIKAGGLSDMQLEKYQTRLDSLIKQRKMIQNRINTIRKKIKLGIASYSKGESGRLKSVVEKEKDQEKIDKNNQEFLSIEEQCLIAPKAIEKFDNFNTFDETTNFALKACAKVRQYKVESLRKKQGHIAQKQASFVGKTVENTINKVNYESKKELIRMAIEKAVDNTLAKSIIEKRELQMTSKEYESYLTDALADEENPLLNSEKAILKTNNTILKTRLLLLQTKNGILRGLQRYVYNYEEINGEIINKIKQVPKAVANGWNDLIDTLNGNVITSGMKRM